MDAEFSVLYANTGRRSIPPELLLRAILLQVLFTIRSERQLFQKIDVNLLYCWVAD
jgi:transposase